jgi:acyl transferase domain-containing protein
LAHFEEKYIMSDFTGSIPGIAIIGMAGRFPDAPTIEAFWQNLRDGKEAVSFFSEQELLDAGVPPEVLQDPNYVRARAVLDQADLFDAAFFNVSPREAELTDPQHRLFLECAWEALERAGYDPASYEGTIGVYAGVGMNTYMLFNLYPQRHLLETAGFQQAMLGNDKDFLPTRVSYKLNLTGPSVSINTACSTSLVAVHFACQSLLNGECDIALSGASRVLLPQITGYLYQVGAIHSPDGHCRAFDAQAQGTVSGSAVGIVVLKRLADALADGDTILAVIKGSAINNDGAYKVGFTAPSVAGQARVIAEAQSIAGVDADTISYVEAHGTGTPLGDPIEIEALTQIFRAKTDKRRFCALGAVKTNVGHTDAASGVTGLIKTVLALQHRQIPPTLHFERPNPMTALADGPFYINTTLIDWPSSGGPRRAGVSSFGMGGTNAHLILEEAPRPRPAAPATPPYLLVMAAQSAAALNTITANLADWLQQHPDCALTDVAFTLQRGRHAFRYRRTLVARDAADAAQALVARDPTRIRTNYAPTSPPPVVLLFPGQGTQYTTMSAGLYATQPAFRDAMDDCAARFRRHLGFDLREIIFGESSRGTLDSSFVVRRSATAADLDQTEYAQPAIFAVCYALAQLWLAWGLPIDAMLGHSLGEYVAACLAGVLTLDDAVRLVALRGQLMQAMPTGAMLAVGMAEADLVPLLGSDLALAAVNGPAQCVVSGALAAIDALAQQLHDQGVTARRLHTSHAYHSPLMEPVIAPLVAAVRECRLRAPQRRYISSLSGRPITAAEATDPAYWGRQMREPVRFAAGLAQLVNGQAAVLVELGPGQTLSTLARQQAGSGVLVVATVRHAREQREDAEVLFEALGQLWLAGVSIDWARVHAGAWRRRVLLPGYPFQRQRFWIEADHHAQPVAAIGEAEQRVQEEPHHPRPGLTTDYVAPADDTQTTLVAIWQQLLGIEPIGIYDNFFELGGHSLLATQLMSQLRTVLHVELPVRQIFEVPTIAALAQAVEQHLSEQVEHAELLQALAEVKQLSPDEVQALLAAEQDAEDGDAAA